MEQYLQSFDKVLATHGFQKINGLHKCSPSSGKAHKVFVELSLEDSQNYDSLKQASLTAYSRVPEFYRKCYRSMDKGNLESYSNSALC